MRWSTSALRLHVESVLAGRVIAPFRLRENKAPAVVPTGIESLDAAIGGLPRGCLTEIYGPPCSGKTSILHAALAGRTSGAEACALVDAQDSFDPVGSQAAGIVLPRLLWVRCHGVDESLRSLDLLLHGGGFGLVALDLGDAPVRLVRQISLSIWFRLRRAVEDTSTILLVMAQESNAKTCASLVLRVEREETEWALRTRAATELSSVTHTPGCLLDGSGHGAEVVRTFQRYKRPQFIDGWRNARNSGEELVRFETRDVGALLVDKEERKETQNARMEEKEESAKISEGNEKLSEGEREFLGTQSSTVRSSAHT